MTYVVRVPASFKPPDAVEIRRQVQDLVERQDCEALVSIIALARQDAYELHLRLAATLKETWGSRSEKLTGAQLELVKLSEQSSTRPETDTPALPEPPPVPEPQPVVRRKRGGRKKLAADLPRRRVVLEPPEPDRVGADGTPLKCIGEDVREALNWIPGRLEVIEYVLPKYADPDGEPGMIQASPALPLPGAIPTAALLAHVIVDKYRWHLPAYRISQMIQGCGAHIPCATLDSWFRLAAPQLKWFHKALLDQTVSSRVLASDDTPVSTLDRSVPRHVKRGHVWLHVGDGARAYQYTPSWDCTAVRETLNSHAGPLQTDGFKGFDKLFGASAPATRIRVGCMMHARRGFKKALDAQDDRAARPLDLFRRLYAVEAHAGSLDACGNERRRIREQYSRPVMDSLRAWLDSEGKRAVPKSPLGKAVTYAVNQWPTLVRFLDDGDIPIDNGRTERGLRPVGRGRAAWLFFGSDAGGERAVIFMTCIANCLLHGVDPEAWLTDVFTRLAEGWKGNASDLLPAAWAKQQAQHADAQQLPAG